MRLWPSSLWECKTLTRIEEIKMRVILGQSPFIGKRVLA